MLRWATTSAFWRSVFFFFWSKKRPLSHQPTCFWRRNHKETKHLFVYRNVPPVVESSTRENCRSHVWPNTVEGLATQENQILGLKSSFGEHDSDASEIIRIISGSYISCVRGGLLQFSVQSHENTFFCEKSWSFVEWNISSNTYRMSSSVLFGEVCDMCVESDANRREE